MGQFLALMVATLLQQEAGAPLPPRMIWAKVSPVDPTLLIVHGRHLVPPGDPRAHKQRTSATLGDEVLEGIEPPPNGPPNMAAAEVQMFAIAKKLSSNDQQLVLKRADGQTCQTVVRVPSSKEPEKAKEVELIRSTPLMVKKGEVVDLGGGTVRASDDFKDHSREALVIVESGGVLRNGTIGGRGDHGKNRTSVLIANQSSEPVVGARLEHLVIVNDKRGGIGINQHSCQDCVYFDLSITADEALTSGPTAEIRDNWYEAVTMTPSHGAWDGHVGRMASGSDNVVLYCTWENYNRGPISQPNGAPLVGNLWWGCTQRDTGLTNGQSEGLLWEAMGCFEIKGAKVTENAVTFPSAAVLSRLKPGHIVTFAQTRQTYTKIKDVDGSKAGEVRLTIDPLPPLARGTRTIVAGNAIVDTTVARCSFRSGKSGVGYWGMCVDSVIVQCDFDALSEAVYLADRSHGRIRAWLWPSADEKVWLKWSIFRNCLRKVYVQTENKYFDPDGVENY